jgi:hypothetical protein
VIIGAAFVPSAPVLIPAVASGAAAELGDVRAACEAALRVVCAGTPERVVIVGGGTTSRLVTAGTGSLRGFGVPVDVPLDPASNSSEPLPLSLTIGAWLLGSVGWPGDRAALEVSATADDEELDTLATHLDGPRTALLVVADGSAARTEKAPASLHPDAADFDTDVARALASGDPGRLASLDADRALEVTAAGRPAWRTAAAALAGSTYDAVLHADVAPYGVGYLVASWIVRD